MAPWLGKRREGKQIALVVHDMRCAQCEASVKLALRKVAGVRRVQVNRRRKQVAVTVDPERPVTTEELVAAVTASGYRAEATG
jgi:copper chaperone CopZ